MFEAFFSHPVLGALVHTERREQPDFDWTGLMTGGAPSLVSFLFLSSLSLLLALGSMGWLAGLGRWKREVTVDAAKWVRTVFSPLCFF